MQKSNSTTPKTFPARFQGSNLLHASIKILASQGVIFFFFAQHIFQGQGLGKQNKRKRYQCYQKIWAVMPVEPAWYENWEWSTAMQTTLYVFSFWIFIGARSNNCFAGSLTHCELVILLPNQVEVRTRFAKAVTWICKSYYIYFCCPLPNQTKSKFDQDF